MTLKTWNPQFRRSRILLALLTGTFAYLASIMIHDSFDFIDKNYHVHDHLFVLLVMGLFIEIMWLLIGKFDQCLPLDDQFNLRAFVQVVSSIILISGLILLFDQLFPGFTLNDLHRFEDMDNVERSKIIKKVRVYSTFGVMVTLQNLAFFGWYFVQRFHTIQLEAEQLHKETVANQLQTLKNQIHPKFWFECLETLIRLVHQDADLSEKFIKKLSLFYRFNLTNNGKELIALEDELKFAEIYIDLINSRVDKGVTLYTKDLTSICKMRLLPSKALQKIIEHTLLHNLYDLDHPIQFTLEVSSDNCLMLQYKELKKLMLDESEKVNVWLDELNQIYAFYTPLQVTCRPHQGYQQIILPLLKIDNNF